MKIEKILDFFKKRWQLIFCFCLIALGFLLAIIVLITRPMKKNNNYIYSSTAESVISAVTFPLEQKIKIDHNKLSNVWIYLENESINDYIYDVELINSNNDVLYSYKYRDYNSNIINIGLGMIEDSEESVYTLKITCDDCQGVSISKSTASGESYIVGDEENTLKIYYEYYEYNNTYYWYSIMAIVIGVMLIPFAGGKKCLVD